MEASMKEAFSNSPASPCRNKKLFSLIAILILAANGAVANDGVFYARGNHLIPITETEITVQKEILSINRVGKSDYVEVMVYYEFFNPTDKEKTLLVGFEAAAPYPNEDLSRSPEHPNIHDFKVVMNGENLAFQVTHAESTEGSDSSPSDYVYHFSASFKPGLNTVHHSYRFRMSSSVDMKYSIPYVLTAACRWGNHQIDDFTLNINMGDAESFSIYPGFYESIDEWTINGVGKADYTEFGGEEKSGRFHIREGGITFHKKDFCPNGELFVFQENAYWSVVGNEDEILSEDIVSAAKEFYYDWTFLLGENIRSTSDDARILRNLPFAYHGYVFKSKDLRDYFESTGWYIPDPDYVADVKKLSKKEKKWVARWSGRLKR